MALLPFSAAAATPPGPLSGVPDVVLPAVHADLRSLAGTRSLIERVLRGEPLPGGDPGLDLAFQAARFASAAWEVPPLPLSLLAEPAVAARVGDTAAGTYGCPWANGPAARAS